MLWRHVLAPHVKPEKLSDVENNRLGQKYFNYLVRQESKPLSGHETNKMFHNLGSGGFQEVAGVVGGNNQLDGRAVAYGDLDNDGDLDLVISNRNFPHILIYRNDFPDPHHFLALKLEGTESNRMGIGTKVTATCDQQTFTRDSALGQGFISQSTPLVWFGFKNCQEIDQLTLDWPSGTSQIFKSIPTNQKLHIIEGTNNLTPLPANPRNFNHSSRPASLLTQQGHLIRPPKISPAWSALDLKGLPLDNQEFQNKTLLLNFWATWCVPCQKEMKDLEHLYQTSQSRNVTILGISLDLPDEKPKVEQFIKRFQIHYPIAMGKMEVFEAFQKSLGLQDAGIPLTILIHQGKLQKFYSGPILPATLSEDLKAFESK